MFSFSSPLHTFGGVTSAHNWNLSSHVTITRRVAQVSSSSSFLRLSNRSNCWRSRRSNNNRNRQTRKPTKSIRNSMDSWTLKHRSLGEFFCVSCHHFHKPTPPKPPHLRAPFFVMNFFYTLFVHPFSSETFIVNNIFERHVMSFFTCILKLLLKIQKKLIFVSFWQFFWYFVLSFCCEFLFVWISTFLTSLEDKRKETSKQAHGYLGLTKLIKNLPFLFKFYKFSQRW